MWLGEFVHWWNLVNVVIMWIGVYICFGGFCWWLWAFELGSNCMSYLLVLIHLVNLFDDNYFGNSNEVRVAYIYIWFGNSNDNDDFFAYTLIWWIEIVELIRQEFMRFIWLTLLSDELILMTWLEIEYAYYAMTEVW
jgi:hypothetical protein